MAVWRCPMSRRCCWLSLMAQLQPPRSPSLVLVLVLVMVEAWVLVLVLALVLVLVTVAVAWTLQQATRQLQHQPTLHHCGHRGLCGACVLPVGAATTGVLHPWLYAHAG